MAFDYTKFQGAGTSNVDLGAPFLSIIQKGSPEFDETHKQYRDKSIAGCKPGQIAFAPDRKVVGPPLEVIPLASTTLYTEWRPRGQGGGFIANHPVTITSHPDYRTGDPDDEKDAKKEYLGNNELIYTITFAVLWLDKAEWREGLIAFTSTQLRKARAWGKDIRRFRFDQQPDFQPPAFARVFKLTVGIEHKPSGSYYGWNIDFDRVLNPDSDEMLLTVAADASQRAASPRGLLPRVPEQKALHTPAATEEVERDIAF